MTNTPIITAMDILDVRFPTSEGLHGSDAVHPDPDYSCVYVVLHTNTKLKGNGLAFTLGRGNQIIKLGVEALRYLVIGLSLENISNDFGKIWHTLASEGQLRWLGPEKGAVHMSMAAIVNAMWDLWSKYEKKPLWLLLTEMEPERLVKCLDFTWVTDVLTPQEAIILLKKNTKDKDNRIKQMQKTGYPGYTTSAGWLGYSEDFMRTQCRKAISAGFNMFKAKVGSDLGDDIRRLRIIREEIGYDRILGVDANQKWDIQKAIDWMKALQEFKLEFIEEPTSPDDILGHATIRKALAPLGIKVATGECCANRVMWKQLFQAESIDIAQIDATRMGGVNEVILVMLMAAKFGIPVCPHAGGVGLCEMVQHLIMFDYCAISGKLNFSEYVDHLHEHFTEPCVVKNGHYIAPTNPGYSSTMHQTSLHNYQFPHGPEWQKRLQKSKKQKLNANI